MTFLKKFLALCFLCGICLHTSVSVLAAGPKIIGDNPYVTADDDGTTKDIAVIGSGKEQKDALVNVIKGWINWVLGILALIALIVLMYGGFLMVTASGNEDQYNKGFTILKQAAIGLILIGVAWFIISIVFWLVNLATGDAEGSDAGTGA